MQQSVPRPKEKNIPKSSFWSELTYRTNKLLLETKHPRAEISGFKKSTVELNLLSTVAEKNAIYMQLLNTMKSFKLVLKTKCPPGKSSAPDPFLIDSWACNQCQACKAYGFVRETGIYFYYMGRFPIGADAFKTAVTGSSEQQRPGYRDRVPVCPSMSIHPIQCSIMNNLHINLENRGEIDAD